MPFASINPTSQRTNQWNFREKILRIGGAGKWSFFLSRPSYIFSFSISFFLFFFFLFFLLHFKENKQPIHMRYHFFLHYGCFFSESWQRGCPNWYAHDCNIWPQHAVKKTWQYFLCHRSKCFTYVSKTIQNLTTYVVENQGITMAPLFLRLISWKTHPHSIQDSHFLPCQNQNNTSFLLGSRLFIYCLQ